jgi:hypothetical protein
MIAGAAYAQHEHEHVCRENNVAIIQNTNTCVSNVASSNRKEKGTKVSRRSRPPKCLARSSGGGGTTFTWFSFNDKALVFCNADDAERPLTEGTNNRKASASIVPYNCSAEPKKLAMKT